MSATITTIGTVKRQAQRGHRAAEHRGLAPDHSTLTNAFTGKLYRFHGMRVLDLTGRPIGVVDWVWSGESGEQGEFMGVKLQWLRGKARPIPCWGAAVDTDARTVRVRFRKEEIRRVSRRAIDRD